MQIKMNIMEVAVGKLLPRTDNYNEQDEFLYDKTKTFMEAEGQTTPLIVRENTKEKGTYEILNGYHRWMAAKDLGWAKLRVNNLGVVSDDDAKLLMTLLIEIRGRPNIPKLAASIFRLYHSDNWERIANILPLNEEDIEHYLKIHEEQGEGSEVEVKVKVVDLETWPIVTTIEQSEVIDQALGRLPENLTTGEKILEIAEAYASEK